MTYTLIELVKDNLNSWLTEVTRYAPVKEKMAEVTEELSNTVSLTQNNLGDLVPLEDFNR